MLFNRYLLHFIDKVNVFNVTFEITKADVMNKFLKLDPEQKFVATVAAIALSFPALILLGYAISSLIRTIF